MEIKHFYSLNVFLVPFVKYIAFKCVSISLFVMHLTFSWTTGLSDHITLKPHDIKPPYTETT